MRLLAALALLGLIAALPALAQTTPHAPGIDAADDRVRVDVTQMPWRAIGKVQTNLASSCTGTLVGARLVLTAGHCVYQKTLRNLLPPSSLHFLAGFKSGDFAAHAQVVKLEYPPGLLALLRGQSARIEDDWVILVLDQALGDRFGILPPAVTPLHPGYRLQSAGYSQDHRLLLMADPACQVTRLLRERALFGHDCEVTHGNSGGPLLALQEGQWHIAGIVQGIVTLSDKSSLSVAVDIAALRERLAQLQ
jgi:protease YdgD